VTLTWNPTPSATAYVIEAGSRPGAADLAQIPSATPRYTVDVPPGTFYVRVRAVSAAGVSGASNEITVRGPGGPQAPTGLASTSAASTLTLRWSAPAGGPPPSAYVLEAGSAPGIANLAVVQLGNLLSYTAITPPPGTYYVRVRAVNARGSSNPSNEIAVTVRR
jgi:predicted phage tail protein